MRLRLTPIGSGVWALTSAEGIGDWDAVQRNATELLGWIEDGARGQRVTEEAT